jgi:putative inorganic carbon (HCO3(-)) transporter
MVGRINNLFKALASLEIWIVTPLVAASLVSARVFPVVVSVAVIFWFIRWIGCGRLSRRTPADLAILLLLLTIPVTLWATSLPEITIPQTLRLVSGVALYFAIVNWAHTPKQSHWLAWGLTTTGFMLALVAPFSVEWSVNKSVFIPNSVYTHFPLLVSDTIHPNVMAGSLIILIPLPLAWLFFNKDRKLWGRSLLAAFALLVMLVVLALTKSRGAWMALGAVLGILLLMRWRWGWVVLVAGALLISVVIYRIGLQPVVEALSTTGSVTTLDLRLETWSRAIFMIQDFPLTGVGLGTYGYVADALYPFFLAPPGKVEHAHNLFLQIGVDLGIPGLIAWSAILFLMIASSWHIYRFGRLMGKSWFTILGAGLLCSQIALVVHGMTDAVTWGMVKPAPLVWALWGLTATGANLCVKEKSRTPLPGLVRE